NTQPGRAPARRRTVMAAALLLLGGALSFAAGGGEGPEAPAAAEVTHTLAGGEVMLAHPEGLALAVNADQLLGGAAIGCGEALDRSYYGAEASMAGRNLTAAPQRVSVSDDLRA